MKVKICGNTTVEDALLAARLGADAVGVVVDVPVPSPRNVGAERAKEILASIPPGVEGVAVVISDGLEEVQRIHDIARPDAMQLHGLESVELVGDVKATLPCAVWKTVHVRGEESVREAAAYSRVADALLLDTPSAGLGGSGRAHDWAISRRIVEAVQVPVLLAGGLTPENVRAAIEAVRPHGVDVVSGVEREQGRKDPRKLELFVKRAKEL
ncbi:MAG: phosphoribosylanthranilate isomerase [Euryarchaeota archaeon]|nr:phosphoribosylanthranilate isomerase [Euryarchaeota archaeon]